MGEAEMDWALTARPRVPGGTPASINLILGVSKKTKWQNIFRVFFLDTANWMISKFPPRNYGGSV